MVPGVLAWSLENPYGRSRIIRIACLIQLGWKRQITKFRYISYIFRSPCGTIVVFPDPGFRPRSMQGTMDCTSYVHPSIIPFLIGRRRVQPAACLATTVIHATLHFWMASYRYDEKWCNATSWYVVGDGSLLACSSFPCQRYLRDPRGNIRIAEDKRR